MTFEGRKVLALESRRATEIGELIRRQGGNAVVAPSLRELPVEENEDAFRFAESLFAGAFDMMIFLTGVGTRALNRLLAEHYPEGEFADALRELTVVARGPKPVAALRELNVPVTIAVPEPNTWREVLKATEGRKEQSIAVQEYGTSNPELLDGLRARGAEVTPVHVYNYALPADTRPLKSAVQRLSQGEFQVVLFTTSMQAVHLFRIAREMGVESDVRDALARAMIASIGPTTSETLEEFGLKPDMVPSHPKMGFLVKEAAEQSTAVLSRKAGG
jgi:uroporphyrinogen-III synthase